MDMNTVYIGALSSFFQMVSYKLNLDKPIWSLHSNGFDSFFFSLNLLDTKFPNKFIRFREKKESKYSDVFKMNEGNNEIISNDYIYILNKFLHEFIKMPNFLVIYSCRKLSSQF